MCSIHLVPGNWSDDPEMDVGPVLFSCILRASEKLCAENKRRVVQVSQRVGESLFCQRSPGIR